MAPTEVRSSELRIKELLREKKVLASAFKGRGRGQGVSPRFSVGSPPSNVKLNSVPTRKPLLGDDVKIEDRPSIGLDQETKQRGSRLFGVLGKHLKKAKKEEESLQASGKLQKQKELDEEVKKKLQNFQENLKEATRLEAAAVREERRNNMRRLNLELQVEERKVLRLKLEAHYQPMVNFLRTESDPSIFWAPAVYNSLLDTKKKDTESKITAKLKSLREEFDEAAYREVLLERQRVWLATRQQRQSLGNDEEGEEEIMYEKEGEGEVVLDKLPES